MDWYEVPRRLLDVVPDPKVLAICCATIWQSHDPLLLLRCTTCKDDDPVQLFAMPLTGVLS